LFFAVRYQAQTLFLALAEFREVLGRDSTGKAERRRKRAAGASCRRQLELLISEC
jgi:hypothetical protein